MPIHVALHINQNVKELNIYDLLGSDLPLNSEESYKDGDTIQLESVTADDCYSPPQGILRVKGDVHIEGETWERREARFPVTDGKTYYWPNRDTPPPRVEGNGGEVK
jgi:hypothetical protein